MELLGSIELVEPVEPVEPVGFVGSMPVVVTNFVAVELITSVVVQLSFEFVLVPEAYLALDSGFDLFRPYFYLHFIILLKASLVKHTVVLRSAVYGKIVG